MSSYQTTTEESGRRLCAYCSVSETADGNPLLRCARCKELYCTKECQKKHWPFHKVKCIATAANPTVHRKATLTPSNLPDNAAEEMQGPGIFIEAIRSPRPELFYHHTSAALRREDIDLAVQYGLTDLGVSQLVGYPLRIVRTLSGDLIPLNKDVEVLLLDPDPNSPSFGKCCRVPGPSGTWLVVRSDLKPLHVNHVTVMVQYCREIWKKVRDIEEDVVNEQSEASEAKHELAARMLNPQAFKSFFEERREAEMAIEPNAWKGVEFPF